MERITFKKKLKDLKKNNIAIVGHMGAGKSIVGKILAKKIDFQHIDSDNEIIRSSNKSINKIFYAELHDYELNQRLKKITEEFKIKAVVCDTPGFLLSLGQVQEDFIGKNKSSFDK